MAVSEEVKKWVIQTLLSSSSSSSESENEIVMIRKVFADKEKTPAPTDFISVVVHQFSNSEFKEKFRMSRDTAYKLIENYENSKFYPKMPHALAQACSAENHILSFLWFAGNKCCLRDVAQRFEIGVTTLFRQVTRVTNYLLDMAPDMMKFPETTIEKDQRAFEFSKISNFPNVLGCIDATSITIRTPAHKVKSTYANKHDAAAITLQGICDHNCRFVDVFTGVPANIQNARVLELSDIHEKLPEVCGKKYHLLGDGAYATREWMITPYKDHGNLTESQKNFNCKLSATRVLIKNSFGMLKGRFRQLLRVNIHKVSKIADFITACCVIHNFCIDNNDLVEDGDMSESSDDYCEYAESDASEVVLQRLGERKRDVIMETFNYTG